MGNTADCSLLFPFHNIGLCYPRETEGKSRLQNDSLKSHFDVSSKCHILIRSEGCKVINSCPTGECKASDRANAVNQTPKTNELGISTAKCIFPIAQFVESYGEQHMQMSKSSLCV